jgi:phosphatidate cytidylyltransferase
MFAVVWSTDIIAYFTGRALGGPKLMPRVSPKKTWSGALGGLAAGTAAGVALVLFARDNGWSTLAAAPLPAVAVASALASILSQAGDLAESALKRRCGVKDSGRSIPGHGGVMDRLDGFFAVALLVGLALIVRRLSAA